MQSLQAILKDHAFLQDLGAKDLETLAACAQTRNFTAGEYLWRQGELADVLYLIRSGSIALEIFVPHQGPLQIDTVGAGEAFGWSWLIPHYRWHFDVRAVTPVQVFALDAECLRQKLDEDPHLSYELLKRLVPVLARRLTNTQRKLLDLHGSARAWDEDNATRGSTSRVASGGTASALINKGP